MKHNTHTIYNHVTEAPDGEALALDSSMLAALKNWMQLYIQATHEDVAMICDLEGVIVGLEGENNRLLARVAQLEADADARSEVIGKLAYEFAQNKK